MKALFAVGKWGLLFFTVIIVGIFSVFLKQIFLYKPKITERKDKFLKNKTAISYISL